MIVHCLNLQFIFKLKKITLSQFTLELAVPILKPRICQVDVLVRNSIGILNKQINKRGKSLLM